MNFKFLIHLIFVISFPVCAQGADAHPEQFIKKCFKQYLDASSQSGRPKESDEIRKKCLSEDFLSRWDRIVSIDGAGMDGLLLAQDILQTWPTNIRIRNLDKKSKSAELVLGKGSEGHCLLVKYENKKSDIRIQSVDSCSK